VRLSYNAHGAVEMPRDVGVRWVECQGKSAFFSNAVIASGMTVRLCAKIVEGGPEESFTRVSGV
jgi:hypothetical protein